MENWKKGIAIALASKTVLLGSAQAFGFVFAGESNGVDIVTHATGYNGIGGTITVDVGIDSTSLNAADMVISVQNVINTINNLVITTGNLDNSVIGGALMDFESVLLHEMMHSVGFSHVNLGVQPGVSGANTDYTYTTNGADNVFSFGAGVDGVIGSSDDLRGDDVNLNYFRTSNNNPFTIGGTVDSTTYSRDIADLPLGHNFSANASRDVGVLLGVANTEAVTQQGSFFGEVQRTLAHDDVAGLMYQATGVDSIAGTLDDYTLVLNYVGLTGAADILIDFDNAQTGFAVSQSGGSFIPLSGGQDIQITSNDIYFNDGFNWFFNDISNSAVPEPSSALLGGLGMLTLLLRRRR